MCKDGQPQRQRLQVPRVCSGDINQSINQTRRPAPAPGDKNAARRDLPERRSRSLTRASQRGTWAARDDDLALSGVAFQSKCRLSRRAARRLNRISTWSSTRRTGPARRSRRCDGP